MAQPQPPGYRPPQAQVHVHPPTYAATGTVIVTQPVVTLTQQYRETPIRTKCPHCNADIVTSTSYTTGTFAWIICLVLCFVGCDLGCCLIPFCINSCKDCVHTCPNCQQQLAVYRRV